MDWQWNKHEVLVASPIEYLGTPAVDILTTSVKGLGRSRDLSLRVALYPVDSPGDITLFRPYRRAENGVACALTLRNSTRDGLGLDRNSSQRRRRMIAGGWEKPDLEHWWFHTFASPRDVRKDVERIVRSDELQETVYSGPLREYTLEVWDCSEMERELFEEVDFSGPAHRRSLEYGVQMSEWFGGYA